MTAARRRSMTGFGRGEAALDALPLTAEVRSVNSRHLDLRLRLPRELAAHEALARRIASRAFERGAVEVTVRLGAEGATASRIEVDFEAARRYVDAAHRLAGELGLAGALGVETLLGLPGVARLREPEIEESHTADALAAALEAACAAAIAMREREGEALAAEIRGRLGAIEQRVDEVEARAADIQRSLRERLERRIAALAPELDLEPGRLEQEVVFYADRLDVTEEVVRWRSHLAQFREALAVQGAIGRKLEFLLQEMVRETNTIGSKAQDAPIAHVVVELKAELEKLREQVLNLE